jgi:uncharacterized repeat protein (TIGR02543 family)
LVYSVGTGVQPCTITQAYETTPASYICHGLDEGEYLISVVNNNDANSNNYFVGGYYTQSEYNSSDYTGFSALVHLTSSGTQNITLNIALKEAWQIKFDKNFADQVVYSYVKKNEALPYEQIEVGRVGYRFDGYNSQQSGNGIPYSIDNPVTENVVYYAQWTQLDEIMTINGVSNAGVSLCKVGSPTNCIGSETSSNHHIYSDNLDIGNYYLVISPHNWQTPYYVKGYYGSDNVRKKTAEEVVSPFTYEGSPLETTISLTAGYKITFQDNYNNYVVPQNASFQSEFGTTLPTVSKHGFTFGGWYTGENGTGSIFDISATVSNNVTYYPKYTEIPVNITGQVRKDGLVFEGVNVAAYKVVNGNIEVSSDYNNSSDYSDTNGNFSLHGLTSGDYILSISSYSNSYFAYIDTYGNRYNNPKTIPQNAVIHLDSSVQYNTILNIASSYNVQFNHNDKQYPYIKSENIGITQNTFGDYANMVAFRDGYRFDGWYTSKTSGTKINSDTPLSNTTVYAHWTPATTVNVTIDNQVQNTEFDLVQQQVPTGTTWNNISKGKIWYGANVTRAGYTFEGYYTETDGGELIADDFVVNSSMTVYAHWAVATINDNNDIFPIEENTENSYQAVRNANLDWNNPIILNKDGKQIVRSIIPNPIKIPTDNELSFVKASWVNIDDFKNRIDIHNFDVKIKSSQSCIFPELDNELVETFASLKEDQLLFENTQGNVLYNSCLLLEMDPNMPVGSFGIRLKYEWEESQ